MRGICILDTTLFGRHRSLRTAILRVAFLFIIPLTHLLIGTAFASSSIKLQLAHNQQFQNAGFYAAHWKGTYSEYGLDVDIQTTSSSTNPDFLIDKVINGEADFGIASMELLAAYSDDAPIVTYATIFQRTDISLYALEHTLISTAKDLQKLRVTVPPGTRYELPIRYLLNQSDNSYSQFAYRISKTPLLDLKEGKTDVIVGSSLTTPYNAERNNIELQAIPFEKFGLDLPGQTLFSSREFYEKNRDIADDFVFASLKGWEIALENSDEIALELTRRSISKTDNQTGYGIGFYQADQVRSLMMYPVVSPGNISFQRWKKVYTQFQPVLNTSRALDSSFINDPVKNLQRQAEMVGYFLKIGIPLLLLAALMGFMHIKERSSNRKKYETKLYNQATHDSLTGLANREYASIKLDEWIEQGQLNGEPFCVMFLDLDGFKAVNDTASHSVGDQLLISVTERLSNVISDSQWLARIGGDEFLILSKATSSSEIAAITKAILGTMVEPFKFYETQFVVGVSIGIAMYPEHGETAQELLSHADAAMYNAKDQGKNRLCIYTEELSLIAKEKLDIANQLSEAINKGELFLCYQPIVSISTGKPIGAEALLRWNSPVLGLVQPDKFISIAEETGRIKEIGDWVLNTALADMMHWNSAVSDPIYVSVNVSPSQVEDPTFINRTLNLLSEKSIHPELLKIEITENLLLHNTLDTAQLLAQLSDGGIDVFLDDFGTGYSSLSYLKNLPFSVVKVDRDFIKDITTEVKNVSLVKAIVAMAAGLNMKVICEGVETTEQANCLIDLDCHYAQGFLFSKPLNMAEFQAILSEHYNNNTGYNIILLC